MNDGIIVIGGNHHNTLGVIRSLGRRGIIPDVILISGEKKPFVGKSRYVNRLYIVSDDNACLEILLSHQHEKPIPVIACSDQASLFLDSNKEILKDRYHLPGTLVGEGLTYWMDKENMSSLAASVGLLVPHSFKWEEIESENIVYPVIVKPLRSVDGCKSDICIVKNTKELTSYLDTKDRSEDFQIQTFVSNKFEYQLIGCSIDSGREVIIPGYSEIIRQPENTNTGFLSYHRLDGSFPIHKCEDFIRRTSYSGLFSMEFLRAEDGQDYFMEINFRNDGNAICVTASGINLPYIWYAAQMGLPYSEEREKEIQDVLVIPEIDDFLSQVAHGKISLMTWAKDIRRSNCFMDYAKDDRAPFFGRLRFEMKRIFKKFLKV